MDRSDQWKGGGKGGDGDDGGYGRYGDGGNEAGGEEGVMATVHIRYSLYQRCRWQHRYCNEYHECLQSIQTKITQLGDLPEKSSPNRIGVKIMARVIPHLDVRLARGAMLSCKRIRSALLIL